MIKESQFVEEPAAVTIRKSELSDGGSRRGAGSIGAFDDFLIPKRITITLRKGLADDRVGPYGVVISNYHSGNRVGRPTRGDNP
jgi:hypothetical protein